MTILELIESVGLGFRKNGSAEEDVARLLMKTCFVYVDILMPCNF
jgi:hypothetical protein